MTWLGNEKEMKTWHNQPHLVPPMKLIVYDDLPPTPGPRPSSQLSQWVAQGRNFASRASERASLSIRRKSTLRPTISLLQPLQPADDLPFRRLEQFRPLELSIYLPGNRLSDLPEFGDIDFNVDEIQMPPRALIRSRSETALTTSPSPEVARHSVVSMVEERSMNYRQRQRSSSMASVISNSSPPSEYDALHSHPVGWTSLPGLPAQAHHREKNDRIEFPRVEADPVASTLSDRVSAEKRQPFKLSTPPTPHSYHSRLNSSTRNRVSQWLSRSGSINTVSTLDPNSHRASKSHFYHCAVLPPEPPISTHGRHRTMSASTVASSTVSGVESISSLTSMTTAPTTQGQYSRTNTIKSFGKHTVIADQDLPGVTMSSLDVKGKLLESVGETLSPRIGIAF